MEEIRRIIESYELDDEDISFLSFAQKKIEEIKSLSLEKEKEVELLNLTIETIKRHFEIKKSFNSAKSKLKDIAKFWDDLLKSLQSLSDVSNELRKNVTYLHDIHEKSKESLKNNKFLEN